ncbi:ACP S-malonyltransferase [Nocardia sp. NPDC056064]|uniref:ACP S-malonyltransferase n=1 Tax=Nocardia sp. NPDC056064 TaxID=3345701 RepID=UPI0035D96DFF
MRSAVFLTPGQGGDPTGALRVLYEADDDAQHTIDGVLADVAGATGTEVAALRSVLLTDHPPRQENPVLVRQLAVYSISVSVAAILLARDIRPRALIGQSFGEIAALVCVGVFDVANGARAVRALNFAFSAYEGRGATVRLAGSETDARLLLTEFGRDELVVACMNSPRQTLISGPVDIVEEFMSVVRPRQSLTRLRIPYAAHHPELGEVAEQFYRRLAQIPMAPSRIPMYSPVRRRAYHDGDDLRRALADCVTKPVYLTETLSAVAAQSPTLFVELGSGEVLCDCVRDTVPGARTLAPLVGEPTWLTTPPPPFPPDLG